MSDYDLVIIGAGAAGIGAAKRAAASGLTYKLIEASHRIGGRAYTEPLGPSRHPFDLGCHWLHSASLNPLVGIADKLGFTYEKQFPKWRIAYGDGEWGGAEDIDSWNAYDNAAFESIAAAVAAGREGAVADFTPREDRWTPAWDYVFSLISSHDPDQVSAVDNEAYNQTDEDWAVREGYGALVERFGADVPVTLNTRASVVDWSGEGVRVETPTGVLSARTAIVTVSTGVLAAGDILFKPGLPAEKLDAVHQLPLGCHNRIGLAIEPGAFPDEEMGGLSVLCADDADDVPMNLRIRPFGHDYIVGVTGGRHGDWLERAGQAASIDLAKEKLRNAFGSRIDRCVTGAIVTAWRGDPWVKGAYSAATPGNAGARAVLKEPVADRLFFAGEATHASFYSTCHGAYMSGLDAVDAAAHTMGSAVV